MRSKFSVDRSKWDTTRILYKYGSADSIYKILETLKIKATRADEFNDPFDTLTEIDFGFNLDKFPIALFREIDKLIFSEKEPEFEEDDFLTRSILSLHKQRHKLKKKDIEPLIEKVSRPILNNLKEMIKKDNEEWREFLLSWRIVSLSEVRDSLLLWSHYANNHKGAIIGFRCVPQIDSAFCAAIRVDYASKKPTLGTLDEWVKHIANQKRMNIDECYMSMLFTKSDDWKYEKEWRYVLPAQDKDKGADFRSFDQKEIAEIVLGCRIEQDEMDRIQTLCRNRYPNIHLLQAAQSKKEFGLEFRDVN